MRNRIYPTNALRQWAYRQRIKQRTTALLDAAQRIHHALAHTDLQGAHPTETLQNLAQHLERQPTLSLRDILAQIYANTQEQAQILQLLDKEPNR